MFDRLKKVLSSSVHEDAHPLENWRLGGKALTPASDWAASRGFAYFSTGGDYFEVSGNAAGRHWKLECGEASRDFIEGAELRARADLKIREDVAVFIWNRVLKETLENRAYELYTDSLQTTADPNLPDEMRWLSLYQEVGWNQLSPAFWGRYAVLADEREQAFRWITPALADLLISWPSRTPPQQPFILMLLRGKAYLRMQHLPADIVTLNHAVLVLAAACESAVHNLSTDIRL